MRETAALRDRAFVEAVERSGSAALPQLRAAAFGHRGGVHSVDCSPDSRFCATGGGDGLVRLWDLDNGEPLVELRGHRERVQAVAFSPDGKRIVSAGVDRTARIWDSETGAVLRTLQHDASVLSAGFSPDGAFLVTAGLSGAKVWEAWTGRPVLALAEHEATRFIEGAETLHVNAASFSPEGKSVATADSDATARIWDALFGEVRISLRHSKAVFSAAWSEDGRILVTGSVGEVRLWNAASGEEEGRLEIWKNAGEPWSLGDRQVSSVGFIPRASAFAAAGDSPQVHVFDSESRQERFYFGLRDTGCRVFGCSRDGKKLVGGHSDGVLSIWDLPAGS